VLEYRDDSTCNTLRVSLQLTNFTLECASLGELQGQAPRCGMVSNTWSITWQHVQFLPSARRRTEYTTPIQGHKIT